MTGLRTPGPQCQVKNWFEEAIDVGTSALIRHRPPGPHCQVKYWFQEPFVDSTPDKIKSGKYWVAWANLNAKNSTSVDDLAEPSDADDGSGEQVEEFERWQLLEVLRRIRLCQLPTSLRHVEPPVHPSAPGLDPGASTARNAIARLPVRQASCNRHFREIPRFVKYPRW